MPRSAGLREFLADALRDDQTPFATTALRIMASEFERELQARDVIEAIGHGETAYSRIQSRSGVKGNKPPGEPSVRVSIACGVAPRFTRLDPLRRVLSALIQG